MIQITEIEKDLFKYVEQGNSRKPAALLIDLLKRIEITQIDSFVDLLSRVLKTKKGPKIAWVFNRLNRKIKDKNKLYKTELIFIKKHLLIDGESLIDSFFGTLESGYEIVKGRFFLTNYRIIASGFQKDKLAPTSGSTIIPPHGIISLVTNLAIDAKKYKEGKSFEKLVNEIKKSRNYGFYSVNQIQYGSYYPLSDPNEIAVNTQSLKFSTKISYMSNNERVFSSDIIQITRKRLSNETLKEFQANLAKSYRLIEKTLKDSESVQNELIILKMAKISNIGTYLGLFFKKNPKKAWTAKAILNRVDELNLTNNVKQEVTEKMILETLEGLYKEGFINRTIHEGQFFYLL